MFFLHAHLHTQPLSRLRDRGRSRSAEKCLDEGIRRQARALPAEARQLAAPGTDVLMEVSASIERKVGSIDL